MKSFEINVGNEVHEVNVPDDFPDEQVSTLIPGLTAKTAPPENPSPADESPGLASRMLSRGAGIAKIGADALVRGAASLPATAADAMTGLLQDPYTQPGPALRGEDRGPAAPLTSAVMEGMPRTEPGTPEDIVQTLALNLGPALVTGGNAALGKAGLPHLARFAEATVGNLAKLSLPQLAKAEAIVALAATGGEEAAAGVAKNNPYARFVGNLIGILGVSGVDMAFKAARAVKTRSSSGLLNPLLSPEERVGQDLSQVTAQVPEARAGREAAVANAQDLASQFPGVQPETASVITEPHVRKLRNELASRDPALIYKLEATQKQNNQNLKNALLGMGPQEADLDSIASAIQGDESNFRQGIAAYEGSGAGSNAEKLSREQLRSQFVADANALPQNLSKQGQKLIDAKVDIAKGLSDQAAERYAQVDPGNEITFKSEPLIKKANSLLAPGTSPADLVNSQAIKAIQSLPDDATFNDFQTIRSQLMKELRGARDPEVRGKLSDMMDSVELMFNNFIRGTEAGSVAAGPKGPIAAPSAPIAKMEKIVTESLKSRGFSDGEASNILAKLKEQGGASPEAQMAVVTDHATTLQQAAMLLKEHNAWFKPRVQALRSDMLDSILRPGKQGVNRVSPELAVQRMLKTRKGAEELASLANTFGDTNPASAANILDVADQTLTSMFVNRLKNPKTGVVSPENARQFLSGSAAGGMGEALEVFPQTRAKLEAATANAGKLDELTKGIQGSIDEWESSALGKAWKTGDPETLIATARAGGPKEIMKARARLGANPDRQTAFRGGLWKQIVGDVLDGPAEDIVVNPDALDKILKTEKESLRAVGFNDADFKRLEGARQLASMLKDNKMPTAGEVATSANQRASQGIRQFMMTRGWQLARYGAGLQHVPVSYLLTEAATNRMLNILDDMDQPAVREVMYRSLFDPELAHTLEAAGKGASEGITRKRLAPWIRTGPVGRVVQRANATPSPTPAAIY